MEIFNKVSLFVCIINIYNEFFCELLIKCELATIVVYICFVYFIDRNAIAQKWANTGWVGSRTWWKGDDWRGIGEFICSGHQSQRQFIVFITFPSYKYDTLFLQNYALYVDLLFLSYKKKEQNALIHTHIKYRKGYLFN